MAWWKAWGANQRRRSPRPTWIIKRYILDMTSQGTIILRVLFCFALALAIAGCDGVSDPQPQSGFAPEEAVSSIEGLEAATTGNYNRLISGGYYHYSRHLFYMTEFAGDNISLSGSTTERFR